MKYVSDVNFASLIAFRISLVFSFVIFYLCDRICSQYNRFIKRSRAAVSVLVGPCCPALLELCRCKCAYCCIIGQMK